MKDSSVREAARHSDQAQFTFRALRMSQTQASNEEVSHQTIKMAPRVPSSYSMVLVRVVL